MALFEKGQSGNLKGRPKKGASLRDAIQDFFNETDPDKGKRRIDVLLGRAYEKATSSKGGMMDMIEFIRYAIAPLKATSEAEESGDESEDKLLKIEVSYVKTPEYVQEINPEDDPV